MGERCHQIHQLPLLRLMTVLLLHHHQQMLDGPRQLVLVITKYVLGRLTSNIKQHDLDYYTQLGAQLLCRLLKIPCLQYLLSPEIIAITQNIMIKIQLKVKALQQVGSLISEHYQQQMPNLLKGLAQLLEDLYLKQLWQAMMQLALEHQAFLVVLLSNHEMQQDYIYTYFRNHHNKKISLLDIVFS